MVYCGFRELLFICFSKYSKQTSEEYNFFNSFFPSYQNRKETLN